MLCLYGLTLNFQRQTIQGPTSEEGHLYKLGQRAMAINPLEYFRGSLTTASKKKVYPKFIFVVVRMSKLKLLP